MILGFPARISCHFLDWQYLSKPAGASDGLPSGRLVRMSADFPSGCGPIALPGRLSSHIGALPAAIDPAHDGRGALTISPAYGRAGGRLAGGWVVVQRIDVLRDDGHAGTSGEGVRSGALAFSWRDWNAS